MTLAEARAELQARGFDEIPTARLTAFLNIAKNQFEDAYVFPWLEATGTGAAPLAVTDLKHVLSVVDTTNGNELTGVSAQQIIAEMDSVITATGRPLVWWLDGEETISTYPVTAGTQLSVRYVKESPELSADGDTPLIPARYHQTWVDLAAVRAHLDSSNVEPAGPLRTLALQDLAQIISRYETRNRQNAMTQTIRSPEDW